MQTYQPHTSTRYPELSFRKDGTIWRIYDSETASAIGPKYATKAELLADLDRYASVYGATGAAPDLSTLQAAAPDLLAACRYILNLLEALERSGRTLDRAGQQSVIRLHRKAIAKAEGR